MPSACPAALGIRSKEVEKRTCWLAASSRRILIAHQLNAECIWTPLKSSRRNQLYNTVVLGHWRRRRREGDGLRGLVHSNGDRCRRRCRVVAVTPVVRGEAV